MAKTKRKSNGDFDAILAGFDCQPDDDAPADPAWRDAQEPEFAPKTGATENSFRRLFKNFSFSWPAKFSGFMGGFERRAQDAYDEATAESKPVPSVGPPQNDATRTAKSDPPKRERTEDEAIADELGLSPGLGPIDLKRIRRDFAKRNHPDRFEPARRRSAERRMSIANMLIDEMMRQSRLPR
jgi:hypothetical protein